MEPAFTVAQEPPVPPRPQHPHHPSQRMQAEQQGSGWRRPVRCALLVAVFLAVTGNFAFAAYRAGRRGRDLAFVLVTYFLLALLVGLVARLEQLRRRNPAAGGRAAERRWLRIGVWGVSVALANTFASRVADAMPRLALKLVVWGLTAVVLGLGFYFLFFSKDAAGDRCCDGELGRGQDDAAGRQPATTAVAVHEMSPEEKV